MAQMNAEVVAVSGECSPSGRVLAYETSEVALQLDSQWPSPPSARARPSALRLVSPHTQSPVARSSAVSAASLGMRRIMIALITGFATAHIP